MEAVTSVGPHAAQPVDTNGMAGFKSTYAHQLDDKGRLAFPRKLRTQVPEGGTITLGADGCITFYPSELWLDVERQMNQLDELNPDARATKRHLFGWAEEVTFDRQGRIAISQRLRERAGLGKEVVVVGAGNTIEIWDATRWEDVDERTAAQLTDHMRRAREGASRSP